MTRQIAVIGSQPYTNYFFTTPCPMANTTTPKHTDPATKRDEKKNEEVIKDKPSGKAVKTQKK
jgi:hypothetical protein